MRVRGNQLDPNLLQMYALRAAAKTEAKREAERTRRKLLNAASALAGECDDAADCVVRLSGDSSQEQANRQNRQDQGGQKQDEQANSEMVEDSFSGWA
jgi:hypothetical protein